MSHLVTTSPPPQGREFESYMGHESNDQANFNDPSLVASQPSTSFSMHQADVDRESISEHECQLDFPSLSLQTVESLPATNSYDYNEEDDDMSISASDDYRSEESCTDSSEDERQDLSTQHLNKEIEGITDPPLYVIPTQTQIYSSKITRSENILAVSSLASRFNLSSKAIEAVLELTQIHLPEANIGETSVESLKNECGFGKDYITYHLYCVSCKKLFSNENECKTPSCNGSKNNPDCKKYFVTSKLDIQLKEIFERPGIWELIEQSHILTTGDVICDIKNGEGYRKLQEPGGFLHGTTNITLSLFTDGIPLYKSSSVSLWPVYLLINELPPKERFQRKNLILWGVWKGVGKPQMSMFLRPLIKDLITLHQEGFLFNVHEETISSKAMLTVATMDLQARAYVLNMTQHNGLCGCLYCLEPGIIVPSGKGRCRSYSLNPTPMLRDAESTRNSAVQARQTGSRVDGFFGECFNVPTLF
ncbi:uncharacterized protein [Argopecten irradians]|uniref:uncharacterized protein n=1 Tax=Argopecten irradians TaxID=31199 RepID=UPI003722C925